MSHKLPIEDEAHTIAAGDKEKALFSVAISQRRQANALEALVKLGQAAEAVVAAITGPDGPKRLASYLHRVRKEFETLESADGVDQPETSNTTKS